MLKFIFVLYIGFCFILSILGICFDKKYSKTAWLLIIGLFLMVISPVVAKMCGLI